MVISPPCHLDVIAGCNTPEHFFFLGHCGAFSPTGSFSSCTFVTFQNFFHTSLFFPTCLIFSFCPMNRAKCFLEFFQMQTPLSFCWWIVAEWKIFFFPFSGSPPGIGVVILMPFVDRAVGGKKIPYFCSLMSEDWDICGGREEKNGHGTFSY